MGGYADDEDDDAPEGAEYAVGGYSEDDDFDYEEYLEREFPRDASRRGPGTWKRWRWKITIIVIVLLLIWRFLSL